MGSEGRTSLALFTTGGGSGFGGGGTGLSTADGFLSASSAARAAALGLGAAPVELLLASDLSLFFTSGTTGSADSLSGSELATAATLAVLSGSGALETAGAADGSE